MEQSLFYSSLFGGNKVLAANIAHTLLNSTQLTNYILQFLSVLFYKKMHVCLKQPNIMGNIKGM